MSRNKVQKQKNGRVRSESESSGKWENDDGIYMKGEKAPLSPVSEAPDEEDDDGGLMMYDVAEVGVPSVPDGGYGWVIVFASFMCNLIVDGIANSFGVFLPKYVDTFKVGKGSVAWAGSLLCGVYLCVGPIVSALTNKFGCRSVCIAGSMVAAVGFALSTLSPTLDILLITYGVIGGIGFGLIYLPAVVCVGYYFESKRAFATGIAVCGSGVGTFVFAPVSSLLLEYMDWRDANLIFAGIIVVCAAFGMLMKPLEIQVEAMDDEDDVDVEDNRHHHKTKPLLQRMAEDKRNYLDRGSLAGSAYFMVQLPDGTMERRLKMPLNVDPGVHSSFNLDQLVPGIPGTPLTPVPTLPTITEAKTIESGSGGSTGSRGGSAGDLLKSDQKDGKSQGELDGINPQNSNEENNNPIPNIPEPIPESPEEKESPDGDLPVSTSIPIPRRGPRRNSEGVVSSSSPSSNPNTPPSFKQQGEILMGRTPTKAIPVRAGSVIGSKNPPGSIPRNGSAPQFNYPKSMPKNGSVPMFNQMTTRKHSIKAVPLGSTTATNRSSKNNLQEGRRNSIKNSVLSFVSSKPKINGQDDDYNSMWSKQELSDGLIFSSSIKTQTAEPRHIVRPLSRKDIFYSGSIVNLPEYQSQRSLSSYRQSILNLPRTDTTADALDAEMSPNKTKPSKCPCLGSGLGPFKSALAQMMDFSLLKNPVFLFVAISNVFGMLGFYVPFVYLIDAAKESGVPEGQAAFLLSIIGVTNTIGRVATGIISDMPQVNSLFMNNMCLLLSGFCISLVPFCPNYYAFIGVAVFFGLFVSGYISLTSIILVDLLGLDNLTNAFGLLILFRGGASIIGAPLAGAVYDAFKSYDIPFFLAGGFLIISAFISFLVPCVMRFAPPKPLLQPPVYQVGYLEDIPEGAESHNNSDEFDENEEEKFDQVESSL